MSGSSKEAAYERYIRDCARKDIDPIGYVDWLHKNGYKMSDIERLTEEESATNNRRPT